MERVRLEDLCHIVVGRTPSRAEPRYWGGEHRWLSIADMTGQPEIRTTKERLTDEGAAVMLDRIAVPGTVLLSFKLSIGKVSIARVPVFTNEAIAALPIRDESKLDASYLAHYLAHADLTGGADRAAMGNTLNIAKLRDIEVPVPPLPEQRRIASILDRASGLATSSRRSSALTGTLKQSLFREWFGDEPHRSFETSTMGDLIDPNRPISYGILMPGPETPGGVPYIRVTDFSGGVVDVEGVRKTSAAIDAEFRRSRLRAGDLLFSIRGHVGRTAVVPVELDGANITQDTARLALRGADPEFVREWLATPFAQLWMRQRTKGAAVKGLNLGDLRMLPVPMPAIDRQTQFGDRIRAIDSGLASLSKLTRVADELVASIQSQAFRGEL